MTRTRQRVDPSTLEDILILKFNTDLWNAQLFQTIFQEEKYQNSLCTPGSASTLTTTVGSSSSSSAADNIIEDMDEDERR